ncbi:MAG: caspase family protein [Paracoccaceae bacterium]
MFRKAFLLPLTLLFVLIVPFPAMAERVALVIGMGAYEHVVQLKNTINDADAVAAKLEDVGFKVTLATDKTQAELLDIMQAFSFQAETADLALVYYAGHGVEVQGVNYLIPIDANVKSNKDVVRVAISLDDVLKTVESARKMRVVILDSCRNNPFGDLVDTNVTKPEDPSTDNSTRSAGVQGLAPVNPDLGTLVAFAAKGGQVALDGADGHSPYATALMQAFTVPNLEISLMFRQVRDKVLEQTHNLQEPYTYGSLSGTPFYLAGSTGGSIDVASEADPRVAWADIKPEQEQQLRALADGGDTRSMLGLAYIRLNPKETRYNPAEAVEYLTKAAAAGAPDAQFELAKLYEQGTGVDPDAKKALELYEASAAQGFPDAVNDLGFLYYQGGLGLAPDHAKGIDLFRQAADLRHPEAMFNYAALIDDGVIKGKGPEDSAKYLYQALRSGSDAVLKQLTSDPAMFTIKTRQALQKILKSHNFYEGPLDGDFGKTTQGAIKVAFGLQS